ncbi:MAG: pyridoxal phosphate-dependent aminotransferase family protein [Proteobacteria bacterium]|nr:pyridoxal phosphate-dependent aminotransferase family protein [Pseudomonadota bacterium]
MNHAPAVPLLQGRTVRGPESARIWIDDRPCINFVGCSYLALQALDELRAAGQRAVELEHPWSQMRSGAHGGSDPVFDEVGAAGADFFGHETSIFLPTGYFCGLAAVAALQTTFDAIFIDELGHYSLFDAARLSTCPTVVFAHCDADALRDAMRRHTPASRKPLVLTDGVFATTGRIPPLAEYARIAGEAGGQLFVDESHAYGVVGRSGRGAAEYCGVADALHAGTLGKGFCAQGGLLPCTREFAARVRGLPPVRGAGAGSPVSALVGAAALRYARAHPERREHLHAISRRLKTGLRGLGLEIVDSPAPIAAFSIGRKADMLALQRSLFDDGMHVALSSYIGSGPEGMLRCATFADHAESDIDRLIEALRRRL